MDRNINPLQAQNITLVSDQRFPMRLNFHLVSEEKQRELHHWFLWLQHQTLSDQEVI